MDPKESLLSEIRAMALECAACEQDARDAELAMGADLALESVARPGIVTASSGTRTRSFKSSRYGRRFGNPDAADREFVTAYSERRSARING
jgi:hypothetical protein